METIKSYTEDEKFIYINLPNDGTECVSFLSSEVYPDKICIVEQTHTPQELLSIAVKKLNDKFKSMPDFEEVFEQHVKECSLENKDPFTGFTLKAVVHWKLWEDYCEYLIAYDKFSKSNNTESDLLQEKVSEPQNKPCSFSGDIVLLNNTSELSVY